MPKISHVLNDLQLRRMLAAGQSVAKSDGDGLTITISAKGTASWILRYRFGGRRRELTIGNYPDISLAQAREQARSLRAAIDQGADPASRKQQAKLRVAADWRVSDLVEDFIDKVLPKLADVTVYHRTSDFDQVVLPRLGAWRVADVTSQDVVGVIRGIKRTWTMSRRALGALTVLMDHACALKLITVNPCVGIRVEALLGPRPPVRKRVMLTREELATVLAGIDVIGQANGLAFRIMLATCVRGYELVCAKKEDIDLEAGTWWVPDASVKTRAGFLVPLAPVVVGWFRELFDLAGDSKWVLPARQERRTRVHGDVPVARNTLIGAFYRAYERGDIDVRRFTPHDTRSTAKGHMRNLGVSRDVSELALNHKLKGMEGIYDVREEIPERRRALMLWADFLVACERGDSPPPANVVPLRRRA